MNISLTDQYALKAIFDLALQPAAANIKIGDIAKRQSIPQKFLETILMRLKQGGFVTSRRGVEGGYRLLHTPDQIAIGEVLRYMCGARKSKRQRPDALSDLWTRVDAADSVLDQISFAEVARRWRESQARPVSNWEI
jgi:Rrf2 family protein